MKPKRTSKNVNPPKKIKAIGMGLVSDWLLVISDEYFLGSKLRI
jgi:hypothetical protein